MIEPLVALLAVVPLSVQQASAAPPAQPESWSILTDPCASTASEVVVCAPGAQYRMPLPEERERVSRPRQATNDPRAGLENSAPPCALRGCQVGVDLLTPAVAVAKAAYKELEFASRKKHPGKREAIPLE